MNDQLFYYKKNKHIYTKNVYLDNIIKNKQIYLPLIVDTEFITRTFPYIGKYGGKDVTITIQVKGINSVEMIFLHPEIAKIASSTLSNLPTKLPLFESDFIIFDYLKKLGVIAVPTVTNPNNTTLYVDIIGHFLVSDYLRIVNGLVKDRMLEATVNNKYRDGIIIMDRRLKAMTGNSSKSQCAYIDLPIGACINGQYYNISVGFIDTCAIQGAISLKDLYSNTNVNTASKDLIQNYDKETMLDIFISDQARFIKYALGDLKVYDAFQNHNQLLNQIYTELGLSKYFKGSSLTLGTTVSELFTASIRAKLGITKAVLMREISKGSVQDFLACKNKTSVYLTKTNGGRCFNNKPLTVSSKGIYTRVDIKSCYGNSLRNQLYPIGNPIVIQYPRHSKINHYMSLREVLGIVRTELVDGLWMFRVSTEKDYTLKYKNDMLMSWYPPDNLNDLSMSDTDYQGLDSSHQNDQTRFYSSEVHLAPITYAELEWIEKVCSQSQKNEYLDRLMVISGVYYPKSKRVNNYEEYSESNKSVNKGNTWEVKENNSQLEIIEIGRENNTWFSLDISDLILDKLTKLREQYPKENADFKPMNTLLKTIINTVYGILVSPKFSISKSVVGNNVTSRGRAMAWYLEKSLNGYQTITDSVTFDLESTVFIRQGRKVNAMQLYNIYGNRKKRLISLKSLGGVKYKQRIRKDFRAGKDAFIKIETENFTKMIKKHLATTLPDVSIPKLFEVSIEEVFTEYISHSVANYQTRTQNIPVSTKMRGYKNQDSISTLHYTENQTVSEVYNPVAMLFESIYSNPERLTRIQPIVENTILKTKAYKKNWEKYSENGIHPGQTIQAIKKIREVSISQFQFESRKQENSWRREEAQLYKRFNQGYEMFFTVNNTLDMSKAITELGNAIQSGKLSYRSTLTKKKNKNINRYCQVDPRTETVEKLQNKIVACIYNETQSK